MPQRQLTLWDSQLEAAGESGAASEAIDDVALTSRSEIAKAIYLPIKRVSLVHESSVLSRPMLSSQQDAKKFFRDYWQQFPGNEQERFVVACLNTKNRVECVLPITTGTLDASLVHPREVFRPAIVQGASSIIVSHNHPSGDSSASKEDHAVPRKQASWLHFVPSNGVSAAVECSLEPESKGASIMIPVKPTLTGGEDATSQWQESCVEVS